MRKKRLLWQIFPSYLLITLIALLTVTWYASSITREFYIQQRITDLQARGRLIEDQIFLKFSPPDFRSIDALCKTLGEKSKTRITVVLPDGKVIGDSEKDPVKMDNHLDRPEIIEALKNKTGFSVRYSHTVKQDMMYLALPKYKKDKLTGFLRMSVPLTFIERVVNSIRKRIGLTGAIIAFLSAIISLLVSWRISRPLEEMKRGVEKFSEGDLAYRLPAPSTEEMSRLAEALNQMASQLDEKINTIIQQRNEQQAVFQSMVEGVVAVDQEERFISINQAAADLFHVETSQVQGRGMREIIRNTELQRFMLKVLRSEKNIESEIRLWDKDERFLQVQGAVLKDAQGKGLGALIVMNDITRLHRLENLRRDFSASVSHEIRTPLTAIKGSVETLLDGAVEEREAAMRFLNIISKQADRLSAIVEDLLSLAKLEQEDDEPKIQMEETQLREVLESAVQECLPMSSEKELKIDLLCEENIEARINPQLLEQAVVNLVDNAIMYSNPEKEIHVLAKKTDGEVTVSVQDHGCGMAREHLPRIFERFYRVDRARSRKLGGTGLGLAIVKHITQAHKGRVTVESTLGEGSTFHIHLPLR